MFDGGIGLKTLINLFAFGQIYTHAVSCKNVEILGLMMGHDEGDELVINGALPLVEKGDRFGVEVKDYLSIVERIEEWRSIFGSEDIFRGWYHSHPGHGIFLSETDLDDFVAQQEYYGNLVFLVIDPLLPIERSFKVFSVKSDRSYREIPSELFLPQNMGPLVLNTREVRKMLEELTEKLDAKISRVEERIINANLDSNQRLFNKLIEVINSLDKGLSEAFDRQKKFMVEALNQFDHRVNGLKNILGELDNVERSNFAAMRSLLMDSNERLRTFHKILTDQQSRLLRIEQILSTLKMETKGPKKFDTKEERKSFFKRV